MKLTTLREAAQQALEALGLWATGRNMDAVALNDLIFTLEAALAEPVQEPVAWLYASISGPVVLHRIKPVGVAKASFVQDQLDNDIKAAEEYPNAHSCTPLYTSPPQRKPLTDEEINALDLPPSGTATVRDLIRLIERAHGIGVKEGCSCPCVFNVAQVCGA